MAEVTVSFVRHMRIIKTALTIIRLWWEYGTKRRRNNMGILIKREGSSDKKECTHCGITWDDQNLYHDKHEYGGFSCPSCHREWKPEEVKRLPKFKQRKKNYLTRKIAQVEQRLEESEAACYDKENTPIFAGAVNYETYDMLRARHFADISSLGFIRSRKLMFMSLLHLLYQELEESEFIIPEPDDIRLPNGQMDWDVVRGKYPDVWANRYKN
jgi:hypothetical protein